MKCIYCQEDSSDSTRAAHIVPEGLVANDVTLPLGAECDGCNAYAGQLENAFVHHNRLWFPILFTGAPGKGGKPRKQFGSVKKVGKQKFRIRARDDQIDFSDGRLHIQTENPEQYDAGKFRRCLYHIGLNYLAWKKGVEEAHKQRYDPVREYVRYGGRHDAWPYAQVCRPDDEFRRNLHIGHVPEAPGYTVELRTFIDDFYVDVAGSGDLYDWAKAELDAEVGLL